MLTLDSSSSRAAGRLQTGHTDRLPCKRTSDSSVHPGKGEKQPGWQPHLPGERVKEHTKHQDLQAGSWHVADSPLALPIYVPFRLTPGSPTQASPCSSDWWKHSNNSQETRGMELVPASRGWVGGNQFKNKSVVCREGLSVNLYPIHKFQLLIHIMSFMKQDYLLRDWIRRSAKLETLCNFMACYIPWRNNVNSDSCSLFCC